jgi:hypothetical protein
LRTLLFARRGQLRSRWQSSGAFGVHRLDQDSRRETDFVLHRGIGVELGMARRVGLPITDIAVERGAVSGGFEMHRRQPVKERAGDVLGAFGVAMGNDGK